MNTLINYLKVLIIPVGVLIVAPLILGIINLFGLKTYPIIILIIMLITSMISGFLIGKKTNKKGYLSGLALGLIICLLFFLLSLFNEDTYHFNTLIYNLIIIVASIFGGMLGIQKKNN